MSYPYLARGVYDSPTPPERPVYQTVSFDPPGGEPGIDEGGDEPPADTPTSDTCRNCGERHVTWRCPAILEILYAPITPAEHRALADAAGRHARLLSEQRIDGVPL